MGAAPTSVRALIWTSSPNTTASAISSPWPGEHASASTVSDAASAPVFIVVSSLIGSPSTQGVFGGEVETPALTRGELLALGDRVRAERGVALARQVEQPKRDHRSLVGRRR